MVVILFLILHLLVLLLDASLLLVAVKVVRLTLIMETQEVLAAAVLERLLTHLLAEAEHQAKEILEAVLRVVDQMRVVAAAVLELLDRVLV
jgi:hypothetical protein